MAFVPALAVCRPKAVEDPRPDAGLAALSGALADERDPAAVDAVAELGQHGGQHGQRADHRDADDEDRAGRHRAEALVAGEVHARHRGHDGEAGDEDGAPGRRGGGLEGGLGVTARLALLALAADVEQRVVDADREADEQDDGHQVVGGRGELADAGDHAHRADDGGEAEQERQAGGDEGAEGEQQDDERDRERDRLGLVEVVGEHLVDGLAGARAAELLDAQLGMGLL
jgi:hypothetical protein